MLKSKLTTIILSAVCFIMIVVLVLVPFLFKTPIIFDTNDKNIGKETVEWIPDYNGGKEEAPAEEDPIVKGEYKAVGNTIRLEKQETIDADNYGAGYDLMYIDGALTDFTVSANITIEDTEFNEYAKAGFKIAVDEEKYFSAFILPSTGEFCLLSTMDGGLSWIQIWPCIAIPGFDINKPTEFKLVKTGEIIEVYANGVLKHTEKGFSIGADTPVKVGLTSEAVGPVEYKDLSIVSSDGEDLLKGKGEYTISSNTIKLEKQQTEDGDNYAAGYDLFYFDGSLRNFTVATDILVEDTELNGSSKAGLKIAVSESKYFSAFVLPSTGQVTLLSTLDGGASWVQIWNSFEIPGFDAATGTNLKLVKNGETIEVYANDTLLHTENGFAIDAETAVKVGVTSEAVGPVVYDNVSVEVGSDSGDVAVKGEYVVDGSTITLQNQATIDADNYGAGYDLYYFGGKHKDFTISANILIEDTEFNEYAKAGFKIAVSEESYFSAFILPSTGEFCLLCTKDGGLNWIQIWPCISIPEFDLSKPTEFKLVKTGETIEVYANGVLKHTETGFTIGADTEVKVGLTSEAVGPVVYQDLKIEDHSDNGGETAEGTVKGQYSVDGTTVKLENQETTDGDNYAAGYDLYYFDGVYKDFSIAADITVEDTTLTGSSKAGIKIAVDESKYFDAFILPSSGQLTLLSTLEGGASWVAIWPILDFGGYEAGTAVNLKLVKTGETIEVYVNDVLLHTETGFTIGVDTEVKVGLTSEAVSPVVYANIAIEGEKSVEKIGIKGEYSADGNTVKLENQETTDGDNYAAGYDLYYFDGTQKDFSVSADITIEDTTLNASSKAGIKIAVDENKYFDAFILPSTGQLTLLSTLEGGASWVQIWKIIDFAGYEAGKAVNLKLVRTGETIEVYVNDELLHTETGFTIGADTEVKVGLTSEAVSPVKYENIFIKAGN